MTFPNSIRIETLLDQAPAQVDLNSLAKESSGRAVLVTGAAGSIGTALCKRVLALARAFIQHVTRECDAEIRFIGLREGEKLKEQLFYKNELVISTPHERIKRTSVFRKDWDALSQQLNDLRACLGDGSDAQIKAKLGAIVPEYSFAAMASHRTGAIRNYPATS